MERVPPLRRTSLGKGLVWQAESTWNWTVGPTPAETNPHGALGVDLLLQAATITAAVATASAARERFIDSSRYLARFPLRAKRAGSGPGTKDSPPSCRGKAMSSSRCHRDSCYQTSGRTTGLKPRSR